MTKFWKVPTKQDGLAVLLMLETFLKQLSVELSHIRTMILQSDNAGCYQAIEVVLLIAILNTTNQIRIIRFIHTEKQDDKGLIDAHFANPARNVSVYSARTILFCYG